MRPTHFLLAATISVPMAALPLATDVARAADSSAHSPRPNIILIFADDFGYGDAGCYGGTLVPTPNIDRLAAGGVRCTDGYVTAPVCAPSRCGIMTGAYNQRFGMQWNDDRGKYVIPPAHRLMPEALRSAGYRTGHIGKWNIPREPKETFDETHATIDWEADYFPGADGRYFGVDNPEQHASSKVQGIWGPERPGDEYLTDRLGRHAVEFIEKNKGAPFFLYLAFNAVHTPLHAKRSMEPRFAHIKEEPLRMYACMIAALDENVGRVLDKLREEGLEQNTIVAFTSDNGPALGGTRIKVWREGWPTEILLGSAGPLSGHKAQWLEGGFREPYILRWPARLKAGQTYTRPVSTMDLYPTFCAAAGAAIPDGTRLDGVDLLPFLTGDNAADPHAILFWKNGDVGAVREGDWKLLLNQTEPKVQLFNLKEDIGESRDLAADKADLTDRLHKAWDQWSATLPPRANPPKIGRAPSQAAKAEPLTVSGMLSFRQPVNKEGKPYKAYDITTDQAAVYTFSGMMAKEGCPSVNIAGLVGRRVRVSGQAIKRASGGQFVSITSIESAGQ